MNHTLLLIPAITTCFCAPVFAQDIQDQGPGDEDEIVVVGRAQEFYLQSKPSLGNKFPGDLRDIPQSIQILSEQLIKDQAAIEITDLYRNISSVSIFSYSGVTFRGFRQDEIRYDGLLGDPFSGFSVPLLFDIQQVEVIKGPSGALFGGGEPGGLINYVTKRPGDEFSGYATAIAGNFDLYGGRAEITGPLDRQGTILFRLGGAYENTDTFRFNTDKEDIVLSADLEWRPAEATSALFRFDYIEQDFQGARLRGVPVDDDGNFLTSRRFNTNEQTDFQRLEATVFTLNFDHAFSENWSISLGGRYIDSQERQNYHESRGVFTDSATGLDLVRREFRDQLRDVTQFSALAETVLRFGLGGMSHTFLAGGEYFSRENDDFFLTSSDSRRAGALPPGFIVPDIILENPVFGLSNPADFDPFVETDRNIDAEQFAFYVQDQIDITDRLTISLGGRYEAFNEDVNSVQTILLTGSATPFSSRDDQDALTVRTGIVYRPFENISTYFNYSTGFVPQGAFSQPDINQAQPFAPERGRLFELGTKIDLFDDNVYLQLAIYQINKTDVLITLANPDPNPAPGLEDLVLPLGEARSRGVELDLVGDITEDLTFTLSYAYNDTVILEGDGQGFNTAGDQFANAPEHQFGFWTRYDLPAISSLSVAGTPINSALSFGTQYVSEQLSFGGQRVQPFAIFDAALITEWRNLQFQINARNLFDKVYAESGFLERTGHFPGEPRTFRAELTARF